MIIMMYQVDDPHLDRRYPGMDGYCNKYKSSDVVKAIMMMMMMNDSNNDDYNDDDYSVMMIPIGPGVKYVFGSTG